MFLTMCSYFAFFKNDCSYRNNCGTRLHDGDLEQSLTKEKQWIFICYSSLFLCSRIQDLALGILKMLIHV